MQCQFDNGLLVVLIQCTYNDIDMKKLCTCGVLSGWLKVWKKTDLQIF